MSKSKTFNILSIDGGGIRGIIPAMILAQIEKRTLVKVRKLIDTDDNTDESDKTTLHTKVCEQIEIRDGNEVIPTFRLFQLIAGTSTGGILALGLTVPDPETENQPKYTAKELVNSYKEDGKKIFHRSFWHRLPGIGRIVRFGARVLKVKYSSKGIRAVLNGHFKHTKLSEALTSVLVPSYEMVKCRPWFFRSTRAVAEDTQSTHDFLMTDVALATSAAPTYFRRHQMCVMDDNGKKYIVEFIDGGIYANHPAMCAFVEARDLNAKDILIVSLGTGEQIPFSKHRQGWGVLFWARRIFNVILDGTSDTVRYQLEKLIRDCGRFYRFQPILTKENIGLDDVEALPKLKKLTNQFIQASDNTLDELCCSLAKRFLQQLVDEDS